MFGYRLFSRNSQRVKAVGCFRGGAMSLMFDRILNATLSEEKFSIFGVTQGNLKLLLPTDSLKHKTIRWYLGLTPCLHFLEEELIHLVDNAKNVWLIVGQLPKKSGWWDAPLGLRDYSQSNKHYGNVMSDAVVMRRVVRSQHIKVFQPDFSWS